MGGLKIKMRKKEAWDETEHNEIDLLLFNKQRFINKMLNFTG